MLSKNVLAQDKISLGVAQYLTITDEVVEDGDIISSSPSGFSVCKTAYDSVMYGVVTNNAAITFKQAGVAQRYPVVINGEVLVKVSAKNGAIAKGDPLTSSDLPGVAVKALRPGQSLGVATQDFNPTDTNEIGKVNVSLNIRYLSFKRDIKSNLLDVLNLSQIATYEDPVTVFKYFIAAVIVVLSCILGFLSFGRVASKGIDAIGRNPLAGKLIQVGIAFNVLITVAVIAAGVGVAIFILKL